MAVGKVDAGEEPREWPGPLVVAILLAASGAIHNLVEAALPASGEVGSGYPPYLLLAAAVEGACVVGLALRKRWGLVAYASFFPFHQLSLLIAGTWGGIQFFLRLVALVAMIRVRDELT